MSSRNIRCSCTSCDAVWRMSRKHIDRAGDAMRCPVCGSPAGVSDGKVTPEQSAQHEALCAVVADEIAGIVNPERVRRLAEIQRRRSHAAQILTRVNVGGGRSE